MPQEIQFFTIKIFSEMFLSEFNGETNPFNTNSIYKCLKELFQGTETKSQEYVDKYFDNVELDYLCNITLSELEKIDADLDKKYQHIFDPKTNTLSFVNEELWSTLEKIIVDKTQKCLSGENKSTSLKNNVKISQDYQKLLDLFNKRILFMASF
ncbi:hypothetical protein WJM97_06460 [Okeanomitos corallinicola TIOX110]|uniref:Uncharacterized protein n=1 Tax=Okeanomitos corallinicola TIOX110 TaxID=3133117 RepID=A0ABZ2V0J6_9CYAN